MEYFILPVSWDKLTFYLIYFSNDDDGVVLGSDGRMMVASSHEEAEALAKKRHLKVHDGMDALDLASIQGWVNSRSQRLPEANLLYRVWNFFGDVATSLKKADHYLGYDQDFISLHDELFWGCNMPGLTQSQERYELDLSQSEIRNLRSILRSGMEIFQQGLPR